MVTAIQIDQREDVDVNATGKINIVAGKNVYLGSEQDIRIDQVKAGDSLVGDFIRIKGAQGILNVAAPGTTNLTGGDTILEAADGSIGNSRTVPFVTNLLGRRHDHGPRPGRTFS